MASCKKLTKLEVKIMNKDITGFVHKDRNVLTGDSPLAANNLGILAANELLDMDVGESNRLNPIEEQISSLIEVWNA